MWSVRVLSGAQSGQIFDLKLGKNLLGRGANCDIKIQSVGISKEHCEIHVYKDKMMVVDLKSSNGSFVNGVKIQNSILSLGDKLSLFDIIMDVIPTPDLRPKSQPVVVASKPKRPPAPMPLTQVPAYPTMQQQSMPQPMMSNPMYSGANAYQQQPMYNQMPTPEAAPSLTPVEPTLTFSEKLENVIENKLMPAIYKLSIVMPFKQVLFGLVMVYILMVTLLSLIPMATITQESNLNEAAKRAKSVARSLARVNESNLLSGKFSNLSVAEALKEDGIKEAIIIQQSDGSIIAPPEKVGRQASKPFILQARKETRAAFGRVDSNTIGATHPIGIYDATTGESQIKYHAIVYYDVSGLGVDQGRVVSLFMQTLIISSVLGGLLFFIFSRLVQHPIHALNTQIDQALREKSDRTEVLFDYPEFQKLVTNVNLLLNRVWNGLSETETPTVQNRDLEYIQLVDLVTQPMVVLNSSGNILALNASFEQIAQTTKDALIQQHYSSITDPALMQNIEALVTKSQGSPYEVHSDKIPFSQFECTISVQASLNSSGRPEYYIFTLAKVESA